jgi:hypothetical protein
MQAAPVAGGGAIVDSGGGASGNFAEMTAFFRAERAHLEAIVKELTTDAKAERQNLEAQLESQKQELLEQRQTDAVLQLRDQQLALLQARLEAMHASRLLSDEELYRVEDVIADSDVAEPESDQLPQLVVLSQKMKSDAAFARQVRRKFV